MPAPVQVSLRIPAAQPMPKIMSLVRDAEAAGFDGIGVLDSQLLCRETFITLALAAEQTSRVRLFPAVTNPFGRLDSVLAGAVQTVEELAPGRTACVLGTGYTAANTIGRRPATLARMRACITRLKSLLAGESVDFAGTPGRLQFAAGQHIPVLMAAAGPRAIELAAEVADGVMLMVGYRPEIAEAALEHVERGAQRGGRRLEDLEIIWAVRTVTADTTAEARRQARPTVVHWGYLQGRSYWLEKAGLALPELEIPQAVHDIYPDLAHAPNWEQAIAATAFVPDEVVAALCDGFGLVGTADDCARRIAAMADVGLTNLYLMPLQTFVGPDQEIAAFREVVFPRLSAAGYR